MFAVLCSTSNKLFMTSIYIPKLSNIFKNSKEISITEKITENFCSNFLLKIQIQKIVDKICSKSQNIKLD